MRKNIRFIKTKINNEHTYLLLTKCNYCPFLINDKYKGCVKCSKSFDDDDSNVILDNVRFKIFNNNLVVENVNILIPDWCSISKTKKIEIDTSTVKFKSKSFIYEFLSVHNNNYNKTIPDCYVDFKYESDELCFNDDWLTYVNQIPPVVERKEIESIKVVTPSTYVMRSICSCCGELKEGVKRNENNGLCVNCLNDNNEHIKNFIFINNFILKRNSTWSKHEFKII